MAHQHPHKHQGDLDDLYNRRNIHDVRFAEIQSNIDNMANDAKCWDHFLWVITIIFVLKYFLSFPLDVWIIVEFYSEKSYLYAGIYCALAVMSAVLAVFEIREAEHIRLSEDISDILTNRLAKRFTSIRSFQRFFFFRELHRIMRTSDRLMVFFYLSLREWKRLLLIDCPELIIVLLRLLANGSICFNFSSFSHHPCPSPTEWVACLLKILQQIDWAITIILAILMYPCFRIVIATRSKHWALTFGEYCTYKIDKRINKLTVQWGIVHPPHNSSVALSTLSPTPSSPSASTHGLPPTPSASSHHSSHNENV